jgi:hypothetical protein
VSGGRESFGSANLHAGQGAHVRCHTYEATTRRPPKTSMATFSPKTGAFILSAINQAVSRLYVHEGGEEEAA